MRIPQKNTHTPNTQKEAPLNESHINLMQSWLNLRGMDNKLADTRYRDMAEPPKTERKGKSL